MDALGNPQYGQGTIAGGPNYIEFIVANYNESLVLSYNFANAGARVVDASQATPFESQVRQLFHPKYQDMKDTPGGWSSDRAIFTICIGINE